MKVGRRIINKMEFRLYWIGTKRDQVNKMDVKVNKMDAKVNKMEAR